MDTRLTSLYDIRNAGSKDLNGMVPPAKIELAARGFGI